MIAAAALVAVWLLLLCAAVALQGPVTRAWRALMATLVGAAVRARLIK